MGEDICWWIEGCCVLPFSIPNSLELRRIQYRTVDERRVVPGSGGCVCVWVGYLVDLGGWLRLGWAGEDCLLRTNFRLCQGGWVGLAWVVTNTHGSGLEHFISSELKNIIILR